MNKPFRSLLNLCAFSVLLVALYLNFVDLNKSESTTSQKEWVEKSGPAPVAKATRPLVVKH